MSESNEVINDYLRVNESPTLDKQIQVAHVSISHSDQTTSQDLQTQDSSESHFMPLIESISLHAQISIQEKSILGNEQVIFCVNESVPQNDQSQPENDCIFILNESSFFNMQNQNQVKDEPPVLHLRGYTFLLEQMQVTDESIARLSGSTHLHQQILDLIFELKPLAKYSSVIYGVEHFVPNNKVENILLLALLKRSVILFGTQEKPLFKSRYTDVDELHTLTNEFVLSMVKFNHYKLLLKLLETVVISSNYNSNVLLQYALLLDKMGHHKLALEYFILIADVSEAHYLHFIIIHSYYVHMNAFDLGIKYCQKLLKLKHICANLGLKSKCYLYLGIGYYWKQLVTKDIDHKKLDDTFFNKHNTLQNSNADTEISLLHSECPDKHYHILPCDISLSDSIISAQSGENIRDSSSNLKSSTISIVLTNPLLEQSKFYLLKAVQCDSHNHLLFYQLSLVSAQESNMTEAMVYIKKSLMLNSEYLPSLHLLVLLESAHNISSAESLLESVIQEYPDNVQLYMTQAHISISQENYSEALNNLRVALIVWEKLYGDKDDDINNDRDSGQYSVDNRDNLNFFDLSKSPSDKINILDSNKDAEKSGINLSNDELKANSKHVTFQVETPSNDKFPSSKTSEELAVVFPEPTDDKKDALVENFYNYICKTLSSATICHDKLPCKLSLLIDIMGMFARIFLTFNSEEDFVQCLHELFQICVITSSYERKMEQSNLEQTSTLILSKHCADILLHMGLYFEKQRHLKKAKICFNNMLNLTHNHVEALYHQGCIEKKLGLLDRALLTVNQCLQLNDLGVFKGKLYFLMGEIFDFLMEPENASAAYEVALKLNDTIPVCSFNIIPFVWQ